MPPKRLWPWALAVALLGVSLWLFVGPSDRPESTGQPPVGADAAAQPRSPALSPPTTALPPQQPVGSDEPVAASAPTPPESLSALRTALEAKDRIDCATLSALAQELSETANGRPPSPRLQAAMARLQGRHEAAEAEVQRMHREALAAGHDALARLARLRATVPDGTAPSAATEAAMNTLARSSQDPRAIEWALAKGCSQPTCDLDLRERWVALEPDNAAAWLAWLPRNNDPLSPETRAERAARGLHALARTTHWTDVESTFIEHLYARSALQGDGPRAMAQRYAWLGMAAAMTHPLALWQLCGKGGPPALHGVCAASVEHLWALEPRPMLWRVLLTRVAERQPSLADSAIWRERRRQVTASSAWQAGPGLRLTIDDLISSSYRCDGVAIRAIDDRLRRGEWASVRARMAAAGVDEAALVAAPAQAPPGSAKGKP